MEPTASWEDKRSNSRIVWARRRSRPRTASTSGPSIDPRPGCVLAKDLNQPEFDAPDGTKIKLGPQVRGGMALNPYSSLTLSADVDVTSNKTLVPGVKSQVLSLGAEQTILTEFLSFRLGAFKNMQDAGTPFTPTAGLGVRVFKVRLDVGGGYDFREKGALVSGSLSLTF